MLNYRITGDFRAPFRIYPAIEETGPYKLEVLCMIRAEMAEGSSGSNVVVNIPVPRATARYNRVWSASLIFLVQPSKCQ